MTHTSSGPPDHLACFELHYCPPVQQTDSSTTPCELHKTPGRCAKCENPILNGGHEWCQDWLRNEVAALREFVNRVRDDRREADKILCHIQWLDRQELRGWVADHA